MGIETGAERMAEGAGAQNEAIGEGSGHVGRGS